MDNRTGGARERTNTKHATACFVDLLRRATPNKYFDENDKHTQESMNFYHNGLTNRSIHNYGSD